MNACVIFSFVILYNVKKNLKYICFAFLKKRSLPGLHMVYKLSTINKSLECPLFEDSLSCF